MLTLIGRFNSSLGTNLYYATTGGISIIDAFLTQNTGTGGEVRSLNSSHQLGNFYIGIIDEHY